MVETPFDFLPIFIVVQLYSNSCKRRIKSMIQYMYLGPSMFQYLYLGPSMIQYLYLGPSMMGSHSLYVMCWMTAPTNLRVSRNTL